MSIPSPYRACQEMSAPVQDYHAYCHQFHAPGRPTPKGSWRPIRTKTGRIFMTPNNPKAYDSWVGTVKHFAVAAGCRVHDGPVEISMTFFLDRPKNQYRTGKHAAELRPDAQMFPASMPDVDKLARLILDALTGIAWKDDGQVVILTAIKRYADTAPCGITGPGVWITIQGAEPKP